eukprot:COSAG02_NODE_56352_length_286_cov_0.550802_1_plen_87_part_10
MNPSKSSQVKFSRAVFSICADSEVKAKKKCRFWIYPYPRYFDLSSAVERDRVATIASINARSTATGWAGTPPTTPFTRPLAPLRVCR